MRFSICVCTYNRAHILANCLDSLIGLHVPDNVAVEILVIDNNSADKTKDVVQGCTLRSQIPIRYVHEPRQGVSAARNRATKEARGDYLGFFDDECVVRHDWLDVVTADIQEFSPLIIGGPYVGAVFPGTAPKWFKTEYGNAYFLANNFERGYQKTFRASSGNMVVHSSVCRAQQFDEKFGMKGNEVKLGEETLLQERFLNEHAGVMVFYEPGIEVVHYILPYKMNLRYRTRRCMAAGASHLKLGPVRLSMQVACAFAHLGVSLFRAILRDRVAYPYWQNYAYERVIPSVMPVFGVALERFRKRYQ